jgi:hypothetical protein
MPGFIYRAFYRGFHNRVTRLTPLAGRTPTGEPVPRGRREGCFTNSRPHPSAPLPRWRKERRARWQAGARGFEVTAPQANTRAPRCLE